MRGLRHAVTMVVAVGLVAAPAALAQTAGGGSVTATGTGQSLVKPANRKSNASIAAAYAAAQKASIGRAIANAGQNAQAYAAAAGLTLGAIESVSDQTNGNGFYGPGPGFYGPFGPGQFCGTLRQPVFAKKGRPGQKRKVVRFKRVRRCIVPKHAFQTLTVTYAATPAA